MNMLAGPLGLLAGILAIPVLFMATYLNWVMRKDIQMAETEERKAYLVAGRRQMCAIGWKLLLVDSLIAALAIALY